MDSYQAGGTEALRGSRTAKAHINETILTPTLALSG